MKQSYAIIKEILDQYKPEDKEIYNPGLMKYEKLSVIEQRWKDNKNEQTRALRTIGGCDR